MNKFLILKAIVVDSKLTFRIQELPDGKSKRTVRLTGEDLDLEAVKMNQAVVEIDFYKTIHFIKVDFDVEAVVVLTCDRSLDPFEYRSVGSYSVIFEPSPESVSEDDTVRIKAIDSQGLAVTIVDEVRDTVMLGLPAKKIHPGYLDSEGQPLEFETQTFGEPGSEESMTDPRWEKLKKLKN